VGLPRTHNRRRIPTITPPSHQAVRRESCFSHVDVRCCEAAGSNIDSPGFIEGGERNINRLAVAAVGRMAKYEGNCATGGPIPLMVGPVGQRNR
jgi:hypothetical protein